MLSLAKSAFRAAAIRLLRPWYRGVGCIICLHRVIPEEYRSPLAANRALEITPETLRDLLAWTAKRGLEAITLDEASSRLSTPQRGQKWVVWTLDDGYRDNLVHALPVFREHGVPCTVYVTPGLVTGRDPAWWYALERALLHAGTPETRVPDRKFEVLASEVRSLSPEARNPWIQQRCEAAGLDPLAITQKLMLTLSELRELAADPLVTIGAHSGSHHALAMLDEAAARAELAVGRQDLIDILGKPVDHLAYPFGGGTTVGEREFSIARDLGFSTATTTRTANIFARHAQHLHALPRLTISGNFDGVRLLQTLESGAGTARAFRGRRFVTA